MTILMSINLRVEKEITVELISFPGNGVHSASMKYEVECKYIFENIY